MRRILIIALATVAFTTVAATALAYPSPAEPLQACVECHGSADVSAATEPSGPHGGYTVGTDKCSTCHSVHQAKSPRALLRGATIAATCNTCHDGTGGRGVYGAIAHRMSDEEQGPLGGHTLGGAVDGKVTVPGGNPDGTPAQVAFTGEDGGLTCTDCHSAHGGDTVDKFKGDRSRETSGTVIESSRLLRARPTSADNAVTTYGTDWCVACHKGADKAGMNHPVASSTSTVPADYSQVRGLQSYDATAFVEANELIGLGRSNLGYVMPTGLNDGTAPICQQCHEDSRSIANDPAYPQSVRRATEEFSAPYSGEIDGNPKFQNFPHETVNSKLLIEPKDSLCTNCHDVVPGPGSSE